MDGENCLGKKGGGGVCSRFQVDSARPAAGMLIVVTFEVVAFVLGAATGTGAEAGLTAGTAVILGCAAVSEGRKLGGWS